MTFIFDVVAIPYMKKRLAKFVLAVVFLNPIVSRADGQNGGIMGKSPAPAESTMKYKEFADRAALNMSIVYTHNADQDFVTLLSGLTKSMIKLAEIESELGKDPELKKMAKNIQATAEKLFTEAQDWKKKHKQ